MTVCLRNMHTHPAFHSLTRNELIVCEYAHDCAYVIEAKWANERINASAEIATKVETSNEIEFRHSFLIVVLPSEIEKRKVTEPISNWLETHVFLYWGDSRTLTEHTHTHATHHYWPLMQSEWVSFRSLSLSLSLTQHSFIVNLFNKFILWLWTPIRMRVWQKEKTTNPSNSKENKPGIVLSQTQFTGINFHW